VVPKIRLTSTIAISLFVLFGDIVKAGVSNILGTLSGWPMKKLKAGISLGKDAHQGSVTAQTSLGAGDNGILGTAALQVNGYDGEIDGYVGR
jgi:hypothetical protein